MGCRETYALFFKGRLRKNKMTMMIIVLCILFLCIIFMARDMWVRAQRFNIVLTKDYRTLEHEYLNYSEMMLRLLIWDIEKLKK
jgi:ABC-type Fe3+ transport system permease subunit